MEIRFFEIFPIQKTKWLFLFNDNKHAGMRHLLTFLFILFLFQINFAQSNWKVFINGSVGASWHDANNWSPVGVPTISDSVSIPTLLQPVINNIAEAEMIEVAGSLTIENTGTLTLHATNSSAIINNSSGIAPPEITNSGTININNSTINGINFFSSGTFTNEENAVINISNVTSNAIWMNGGGINFSNSGTINATTGIGQTGIVLENSADFNNTIDGEINISNTGSNSIYGEDMGTEFLNEGAINISNPTGTGISNVMGASFMIDELGVVDIQGTTSDGIYNKDANTSFENIGTITINNSGQRGVYNFSEGQFNNFGILTISNTTLQGILNDGMNTQFITSDMLTMATNIGGEDALENSNSASFTNEGTLTISASIQTGCNNHHAAIFTNQSGANLNISNSEKYGFENNENATLNNHGTMTMVNDSAGIFTLTPSTVNNYGTIDIDDYETVGIRCDNGTITNATTGIINIDNGIGPNIADGFNLRNATFTNQGTINVSNTTTPNSVVGQIAFQIETDCIFENAMGANINISDIDIGVWLPPAVTESNTFTNNGSLQIDNVVRGIHTQHGNGNFINSSSGFILISETAGDAILLQGNGLFENSGQVINNFAIGNTGGGGIDNGSCIDVQNTATFNNKSTGYFVCVIDPGDTEPGVLIRETAFFKGTGNLEFQAPFMHPHPYFVNEGTFAPGASPGTTSVTGNLNMENTSKYEAELEGTSAGEFDVIAVDGDLDLDGTLEVSLLNSFSPNTSDRFSIMTYTGTLTGTFSTVTLPASMSAWDVDYGTTTAGEIELFYNSALPVEWVNFDVKLVDKNAYLTWTTASEINASHFIIEKSTNTSDWEMIGNIATRGNVTAATHYSFFDKNLENGITYYRIKQVDLDEQYSYSTIVSLVFEKENTIRVFPNPSSDFIYIENVKDVFQINIYQANGKLIKQLDLENKEGIFEIGIKDLPSGNFILESKSLFKNNEILKFIKK